MRDKADILAQVCEAIECGSREDATSVLAREYPFSRIEADTRRYTPSICMKVFRRDGFIDRYSGKRLVFPGTLRWLSHLLPDAFPFQSNWKSDACHFAYYELFPTIDHREPLARGGEDREGNWLSTSMLKNAAKANFTIEELGWKIYPFGNLSDWDGLTGWFLKQAKAHPEISTDSYLSRWLRAAKG